MSYYIELIKIYMGMKNKLVYLFILYLRYLANKVIFYRAIS